MDPLQYLESLGNTHPQLSNWCNTLADLYQRKLWHQLTQALEDFIILSVFQDGDAMLQLYHNFIADFETNINLLKLANLVVQVSRQYPTREASIDFLEGTIEKLQAIKEQRIEEPIVFIMMEKAFLVLEEGNPKECKKIIEHGKGILDSVTDVDSSVYAIYYSVLSQYHRACQDYDEFHKSSMLYLARAETFSLPESFKQGLAYDLGLAALLGDNIYHIGELLAHPIIKNLLGTNGEWLFRVLMGFNSGDLFHYKKLRRVYKNAIQAQPALVQNKERLLEKARVLCLMEIIFSQTPEARTIPLSVIAQRTELPLEDVENVLMKSFSAQLIEGVIDQVEGTVHVSWLRPRVLETSQLECLHARIDCWKDKVGVALGSILDQNPYLKDLLWSL
ncbi:hypothetical protein QN277_004491 [Acacia crassicarpa]|uniref:PCI domain-containing protein n=1 Tax=Acacia crassicarpa TaxID=499986 RepID=A0AAE1MDT2_9FABA|nr:hypothetical protein QN277_004491 [Acacia crassicarpa]